MSPEPVVAESVDVDAAEQLVVPERRDRLRRGVGACGDHHSGLPVERHLIDQRGRQRIELVGVVDDQQVTPVGAQRLPRRAQQCRRLADVGDVHQAAERAERHRAFGGCAGDPADHRVGM